MPSWTRLPRRSPAGLATACATASSISAFPTPRPSGAPPTLGSWWRPSQASSHAWATPGRSHWGDRHHRCFPALSLIEAGLCLAGSSDAPTGELSPWAGIQSFVTRRAASGQPSGPHEALSVRQAIHAYTSGGAIAMGHDAWRGTLHTGMAADFALLDRDPLSCSVDDLASITARLTVADGRAMHDPDGIL
ncbi:MAG: amidohydrolase family protein [Hyphomicrobiales bacterium]